MGEVWRATDEALGRTVAVKVLRPTLLRDPGFDARFRAEARTMAALTHPNVANIYDYGRSPLAGGDSAVYLVMAYVDGQPLSERITEAGRLSVAETMSIVTQAAEALDAAHHSGIIHRDVKPANLLVGAAGSVTLVDFGVARSAAATGITTANGVLGTALYMAPEQATGRPVSPATDIYALGAVAYHCLAGQPPFVGEAALEIALRHVTDEPPPLPDDVPAAARMLVERALAKDPADRYPTAAVFSAAAAAAAMGRLAAPSSPTVAVPFPLAASGTTSVLSPVARPTQTARPPRSRGRTATLASAGVVLLLGLAGLAALLGSARSSDTNPANKPPTSATPAAPAASPAATTAGPALPYSSASAAPVRVSGSPSTTPQPSATAPSGRPSPTTSPTATNTSSAPTTPTQSPTSGPSKAGASGP
jgi:serine/threonine-protein kinase